MDQTVAAGQEGRTSAQVLPLYGRDLYAWTVEQAAALRERRTADLDVPNLVDEIGSVARREVARLEGRLERLCHQLMLWDYGTDPHSERRASAIAHQRRRIWQVLDRCPSLEPAKADALEQGYVFGRYGALREDERLPERALPPSNPYSWDDAMTREIAWLKVDVKSS